MSDAHLGVAPPSPQLRPHSMDLDPSDDETPHVAPNVLFTSAAPPLAAASNSNIADAIATLFTHMNVIHTDLIKRIGQTHKQIDLIVERQMHDNMAIHNTLSALSLRHTEFSLK